MSEVAKKITSKNLNMLSGTGNLQQDLSNLWRWKDMREKERKREREKERKREREKERKREREKERKREREKERKREREKERTKLK